MAGQTQRNLQTDFEDVVVEENDANASPETPKDVDGIPYCAKHHCRMVRNSGGKKDSPTTYYKCPVKDCGTTAQIIKTRRESIVPVDPVICPRCSKGKKPVICSRDKKASNAMKVVVKCPDCGWKSSAMAVPMFAAQHFNSRRRSPPTPGLGDR